MGVFGDFEVSEFGEGVGEGLQLESLSLDGTDSQLLKILVVGAFDDVPVADVVVAADEALQQQRHPVKQTHTSLVVAYLK